MSKKLSNQTKLKRARDAGHSRKDLARAFGVSVSAIGRAERGQTSGKTFQAQIDQFTKLGKRAKESVVKGATSLPSAPAPKTQTARRGRERIPVIVTPLQKARGDLSELDKDTKVVVYVETADGTTHVLYARGGIEVDDMGDLEDAIAEQTGRQYRESVDWGDIVDIRVEEY